MDSLVLLEMSLSISSHFLHLVAYPISCLVLSHVIIMHASKCVQPVYVCVIRLYLKQSCFRVLFEELFTAYFVHLAYLFYSSPNPLLLLCLIPCHLLKPC